MGGVQLKKFESIEGLRALLAWWVVFAHLLQHSGFTLKSLPLFLKPIYVGILPVYLFMIISGFVISHLLHVKHEKYLPYLFRRYFRLVPVMCLAVLFAYCLNFLGVQRFWPDDNVIFRLLAQFSLFHGVLPDNLVSKGSMSFSPPGWSVSLEWQFYIVAPLILYLINKGSFFAMATLTILIVVFFSSGLIPDHRELSWAGIQLAYSKPSQLLSALHYFVVGMYTYAFVCRMSLTRLSTLFGLGILLFTFYHSVMDPRPLRWLVLPLWIFMVALLLLKDSTLSRLFSCRVLKYLGDISYSTYLPHIFVVGSTTYLLKHHVQPDWLFFLILCGISIPIIAVISSISYHLIERPAILWAKKKVKGFSDE